MLKMQLNKVLKGLLIVVPVLALTACGSTKNTDEGNQTETTTQTVEVAQVERVKTAAELLAEKYEMLRQEHTIYFAFDKATVDNEYLELLQAHADFLVKNQGVKITIEGHADERGTPAYNIALGERRAQSVAQYLQSLGVSSSQISIVSYGEEKPVDTSRTDEGFAKNRRAVLVY